MDMLDQSRSALTGVGARGAHLVCDADPLLFCDPLAQTLLGSAAPTDLEFHRLHGDHPILAQARVLTTFRSRVAEEFVTQAAARGVGQYVLLGAGLDSFTWRNPNALGVFEVDHRRPRPSLTTRTLPSPAAAASSRRLPSTAAVPAPGRRR